MRLPQETIEEIREATDLVALVGQYVTLRKKGQNYFGLCPFHEEKTPSFSVHPERQIFHCFGCGKGGNAFGFLMEIEKLSFVEAVRVLAQKAGITLPRYDETDETPSDVAAILAEAGVAEPEETSSGPRINIEQLTINLFEQSEGPRRGIRAPTGQLSAPRSRGYLRLMDWFAERAKDAPTLEEVHRITARGDRSPHEILMEDRARERGK